MPDCVDYKPVYNQELINNSKILLKQDCCNTKDCHDYIFDLEKYQHACQDAFGAKNVTNEMGVLQSSDNLCSQLRMRKDEINQKNPYSDGGRKMRKTKRRKTRVKTHKKINNRKSKRTKKL